MKKIMFNDKYGLTDAVLEGRKTMTRRIAKIKEKPCPDSGCPYCWHRDHDKGCEWILKHSRFKIGEVVAVAQSYHCLNKSGYVAPEWLDHYCEDSAGYENKMFVRADLMPHQISITNVRVERLQDINDEDCLQEGIYWDYGDYPYMATKMYKYNDTEEYIRPKAAFAALIDKISCKGMWDSNPYVFVYEFELIK